MENLIVLGAVAAIFYLIVIPIIAFSAYSRAGKLQRQLEALKLRPANTNAALAEPTTIAPQALAAVAPPQAVVTALPEQKPVQARATRAPEPTPAPTSEPTAKKTEQHDASPLSGLIGWLVKGNPLAKIGALLLFFGLAYLFKYSVDHALIPIELRLAGAGLFSLALLATGWRLRMRQPLYGLILQGAAVGAFYLTSFAAHRLYQLVPLTAVFALMIVICAASVVLSVLQRAQSLAVVAALGGYLAPLLLSSGGGSPIGLFSYYLMLSAGILAVSIWQIWRPLNLVGFVFTFGVGAMWGNGNYRPEFYTSCQLFLIVNFLIFGIVAPLAALLKDTKNLRFVDGSLVFGSPLLAFGMQYALMREHNWTLGAAFSCLALGAIYLPLARALMRRWPEAGHRMALSFIALGGGFVTLAIPLALSAQWTSLAWALEGLGLVWTGLAQKHRRMAWSGSLLIAAAIVSAAIAWPLDSVTTLLVFGVLALCSLGAGLLWSRESRTYAEARLLGIALWAGGILAWLCWAFDGSNRLLHTQGMTTLPHLQRFGIPRPDALLAGLAASAVSACIWMFAGERLSWRLLRHSGWLLWPLASIVFLVLQARFHHPFVGFWSLAWALTLLCAVLIMRRTEGSLATSKQRRAAHVALCWLVLAVCGSEIAWQIADLPWGMETLAPTIALCALALPIGLVALLARRPWPVNVEPCAWWLGGLAPVFPLLVFALVCGNLSDGRLFAWHYLPLINPLEEAAAFALLMLCLWQGRALALRAAWRRPTTLVIGVLAAWWFNGMLVRMLAYYGDIPWDFPSLWDSRLVQTTLALIWTLAALALMALAKRRASQPVWFLGASVLGLVIAKLILVDSARGGGLARAIAFIGVAIIVLLIGYIAPLPPRKTTAAALSA